MEDFKEKRQAIDEFFTPKWVAEIMYNLCLTHGFKMTPESKCLEPSFGHGVFFDVLTENGAKESNLFGYELYIPNFEHTYKNYPSANLRNFNFEYEFAKNQTQLKRQESFEQSELFKATEFDLVIGNPPYGSHKSFYSHNWDKNIQIRIEGFFIWLALQKLKKDGILCFIINSLWLYNGKAYNEQKAKISELGDLIDAYRLPNKVFKDTDIATDIVIFRKK